MVERQRPTTTHCPTPVLCGLMQLRAAIMGQAVVLGLTEERLADGSRHRAGPGEALQRARIGDALAIAAVVAGEFRR